ncbi:DNA methylase N-4 [Chryseobacterium sp. RP-3-3]|uniref:DNA methylase N-4 n=1 Tax=Chryseobacterium antibioticum TaxID=2728847 RepID=A0A7Y0FRU7_9FLAO|nr:DNA methyltransferase [Chryseobacterium antibioticum]NML69991.1 DNA methylase N-4 [Chryseobacterium antibioticum]
MDYQEFLKNKVIISEDYGFEPNWIPEIAKDHQKDICSWTLRGGRRAIFASFGLGKTFMQLINAVNCINETGKPFLIACPLGVMGEFKRDNEKLNTGFEIEYIKDTDSISEYSKKIYLTNYERIRKGDIKAEKFGGVSFDEASILRNLKTETTNYIINYFKQIPYRFVATATPSPNDYIEILNYAEFLGVADRGSLLTKFFKRNPQKAGDLMLLESQKNDFWMWVSSWAVFINTPSDLGYPNEGYDLPKLNVIEHRIENLSDEIIQNKFGDLILFKDNTKSLVDSSREKRDSLELRCEKTFEITETLNDDNFILWHHRETERYHLEKLYKEKSYNSVFGSQKNETKEDLLIDFSNGKYQYLLTKPVIAGSGCNFQEHCNNMVFVGIDYKFNDFIQAIHRLYRFGQDKEVNVHIIYTNNEDHVFSTLMKKWEKHKELQSEMIKLVREYGLNNELIRDKMERQIFSNGDKVIIGDATLYNNDTVVISADENEVQDNSVGVVITSIPFGNHFEYSGNYNDFGHNINNEGFFDQMDYLVPHLFRMLIPGRVAAIHVKDRIRYSYQNGTSFTSMDDFSGDTVRSFKKHGFHLIGKITITTDVVRENNQTYRLGHSEKCKDGSKMGVGMPEYVLLFRKPPSNSDNAYSDLPVFKHKEEYPVERWQLDAHAYWRSSGDHYLDIDDLKDKDLKEVWRVWKQYNDEGLYTFENHLKLSTALERKGKISREYMTIPPHSNNDFVWTDINRMNTLNARQVSSNKEKHICPLQIDIVDRLIELFSMKGETVYEPFGGLMTVPTRSLKLGRKAKAVELNSDYYKDGLFYVRSMHEKLNMPTLFDLMEV